MKGPTICRDGLSQAERRTYLLGAQHWPLALLKPRNRTALDQFTPNPSTKASSSKQPICLKIISLKATFPLSFVKYSDKKTVPHKNVLRSSK